MSTQADKPMSKVEEIRKLIQDGGNPSLDEVYLALAEKTEHREKMARARIEKAEKKTKAPVEKLNLEDVF